MNTTYKNILSVAVLLAVVGILSLVWQRTPIAFGSVQKGSQYQSTSTPAVARATNLCPARIGMASSTTGVLGAVNILKSGAGELVIYDATTTNASLRGNQATSSIILAHFNTSPTAGSYHFDIEFKRGLLIDYTTAGTGVSSSTISYRCEG